MDSTTWDERYASQEYVWSVNVNRFVEQHLGPLRPGTAIDLAAGECRNAVWLAERGWQVTAVDFSAVGLEKGRRLADEHGVAERLDLVRADVMTWAPAAPVDLVLIAYLQLSGEDRRAVLHRAAQWVRPGGHVFVVAHDRSNVTDGYGGPQSAEVCYDADETAAALVPLVIHVAAVEERAVDTPDGPRVALDTVVMASAPVS
jgi:SAM-dependent methyltransferase